MNKDQEIIAQFTENLFWDVNPMNLRLEKHKKQIVQRVLEYGRIEDWVLLRKTYGLEEITKVAMRLRSLDEVSLSFISTLSGVPKEKFRCYTWKQLLNRHIDF